MREAKNERFPRSGIAIAFGEVEKGKTLERRLQVHIGKRVKELERNRERGKV